MWSYEKKLCYPVQLTLCDNVLAQDLQSPMKKLSNFAFLALSLRYGAKAPCTKAILTDISTECFNNMEVLSALIYQLSDDYVSDISIQDAHVYCDALSPEIMVQCLILSALGLVSAYDTVLKAHQETPCKNVIHFLRTRTYVHYKRLTEALANLE